MRYFGQINGGYVMYKFLPMGLLQQSIGFNLLNFAQKNSQGGLAAIESKPFYVTQTDPLYNQLMEHRYIYMHIK